MDAVTISTAFASAKALKDLLTTFASLKVDAESLGRIQDAQLKAGQILDTLFDLRVELSSLQEQNATLRTQIQQFEDWKELAAKYELASAVGGAVAYRFAGTPEHWACTACFAKRTIQVLQFEHEYSGKFRCPGCGTFYAVQSRKPLPPMTVGQEF